LTGRALEIGCRVTLVQSIPLASAGTRGIVVWIDDDGWISIETTHDHTGSYWRKMLPPTPPDHFREV